MHAFFDLLDLSHKPVALFFPLPSTPMRLIDSCFSDPSKLHEVLLSVLERQAEKKEKRKEKKSLVSKLIAQYTISHNSQRGETFRIARTMW